MNGATAFMKSFFQIKLFLGNDRPLKNKLLQFYGDGVSNVLWMNNIDEICTQ